MPKITFRHAESGDTTVDAVAGSHLEPVLKLAQRHNIPIAFDCQDGQCGSCLVYVHYGQSKGKMAGPLTDREERVLLELGKITQADIERMRTDDFPTNWRLMCQMVVREEDLVVEYGVA
ncbi:ferredoxin [Halorhodospira abdelmalekii]|uniref:2Fe-2S iron-sulfur cluster-binding protein n=1 Tax=Halorhodospira abdelmalekii TaxID=421629 RepID=UPI001906EE9F|nr:2Fe-2S iron-sulfur cluster-binding protein [Halorhodospira abdelmalekii]MBK1734558.1 ferredoxin [Halorhodospira abdelmalekii]